MTGNVLCFLFPHSRGVWRCSLPACFCYFFWLLFFFPSLPRWRETHLSPNLHEKIYPSLHHAFSLPLHLTPAWAHLFEYFSLSLKYNGQCRVVCTCHWYPSLPGRSLQYYHGRNMREASFSRVALVIWMRHDRYANIWITLRYHRIPDTQYPYR